MKKVIKNLKIKIGKNKNIGKYTYTCTPLPMLEKHDFVVLHSAGRSCPPTAGSEINLSAIVISKAPCKGGAR